MFVMLGFAGHSRLWWWNKSLTFGSSMSLVGNSWMGKVSILQPNRGGYIHTTIHIFCLFAHISPSRFTRMLQCPRLKLAPPTLVRRPQRPSTPNTNQAPEANSPSSDQTRRALTLADADHALCVFGLGLAFRVQNAVNRTADTEIRRRLNNKWEIV